MPSELSLATETAQLGISLAVPSTCITVFIAASAHSDVAASTIGGSSIIAVDSSGVEHVVKENVFDTGFY